MILNEGNRDKLLQPYVDLLKNKGIDTNTSELKTFLLKKLSNEGGLHNLSLQSNYYLSGAIRYYLNGDLTINKTPGIFTNTKDTFDDEACKRLNALIMVLRNAYIDSIGTSFLQPEDFGTLKFPALLKKYKSKIDAELGISTKKETKKEDNLNRDENVGNSYSFDIIYNYKMATNYERLTAPGSWCVSYSTSNYNYYISKTLPKSHLVVFRQYGFENVERKPEEEKWDFKNEGRPPKPQDTYGNSLIAFFQSNESYEPAMYNGAPLITSRWNHGSYDTKQLEADRAYTFEEFKAITGVSDEDLQRIYEIWKTDLKTFSQSTTKKNENPEQKKIMLDITRELKYAQIRVNGGDSFENVLKGMKVLSFYTKNEKLSSGVAYCEYKETKFIIDKGQIVFQSLAFKWQGSKVVYANDEVGGKPYIANSLILRIDSKYFIYNFRLHKIMDPDGLSNFVSISIKAGVFESNKYKPQKAIVCRQIGKQCVIFDSDSGLPVKLPNGRYIFENALYYGSGCNNVHSDGFYLTADELCFIISDSSSKETYVYNPGANIIKKYYSEELRDIGDFKYTYARMYNSVFKVTIEGEKLSGGFYYRNKEKTRIEILFDSNCEPLNCLPGGKSTTKSNVVNVIDNFTLLSYNSKQLKSLKIPRVDNKPVVLYDYIKQDYLRDPNGNVIHTAGVPLYKANTNILNLYFLSVGNKELYMFDLDEYNDSPDTRAHFYRVNIPISPIVERISYESSDENTVCLQLSTRYCRYNTKSDDLPIKQEYNRLKQSGYAVFAEEKILYGDYKELCLYMFLNYHDIASGVITRQNEVSLETMKKLSNAKRKNFFESKEKISKNDIVEMVMKACCKILNL